MSIRKLLDTLSEMATTSGSVASVAQPMGGVKSRKKDSIFYEGEKCTSCGCEPCKCEVSEGNAVDGTKTPDAPKVSQFGLWKNSALIGQEQRDKKKSKKKVAENKSVPYEGDRKYNALSKEDERVAAMAHRQRDERLQIDELGNSLMPGGQRKLRLAQETFQDPRASRQHPGAVDVAENNWSHDPWKDKYFGPGQAIKKIFRVKTDDKSYNIKAETEQQAKEILEKHAPGSNIVEIKFVKNLMSEQGVAEGLGKTLKKVAKGIKRASAGWGPEGWGDHMVGTPQDVVHRNKAYDTDTLKKLKASSHGPDRASRPGHTSPRGLQNKVVDRELKKRGQVDEKITKNTPTADVVKDFVHSKNKMFKGDSKKERINRALGAAYGMKKGKK